MDRWLYLVCKSVLTGESGLERLNKTDRYLEGQKRKWTGEEKGIIEIFLFPAWGQHAGARESGALNPPSWPTWDPSPSLLGRAVSARFLPPLEQRGKFWPHPSQVLAGWGGDILPGCMGLGLPREERSSPCQAQPPARVESGGHGYARARGLQAKAGREEV